MVNHYNIIIIYEIWYIILIQHSFPKSFGVISCWSCPWSAEVQRFRFGHSDLHHTSSYVNLLCTFTCWIRMQTRFYNHVQLPLMAFLRKVPFDVFPAESQDRVQYELSRQLTMPHSKCRVQTSSTKNPFWELVLALALMFNDYCVIQCPFNSYQD